LIKFLLLLSASLSLQSALALPLSSVLASNYHVATESYELAEQFNTNTVLNDFAYKRFPHSKLQSSLLTLLQKNNDGYLITHVFLNNIIKLDISLNQVKAQSQSNQSYQTQVSSHTHILGIQNTEYNQKNSYQAKLQLQQTS